MPPYVWIPPVCVYTPIYLDTHICLDTLLYVWTPPLCLNAPSMFGHPPICLDDVWMPPVHTEHKESMLCHTKGCPYAPYVWMALCMFEFPHMCGHPHL